MGANATTFVPAYGAGEVLTAADLSVTNSGIPVFATSTTRDAAFGGSGEKVLAEGQFAYLEDTNTTQYYDGAAWKSVNQSGLVQIRSTAFSAVSSVSLEASTFTSAYYHYKMIFVVTTQSEVGALTYTGRLRATGADDTSANYQTMSVGIDRTGTANNGTGSDQTSIALGGSVSSSFPQFALSVDFLNPQQTAATQIIGGSQGGTSTQFFGRNVVAQFNLTTAFDSFSVIPSSGNISGRYFVYGYN
jgi:hypothetical protein